MKNRGWIITGIVLLSIVVVAGVAFLFLVIGNKFNWKFFWNNRTSNVQIVDTNYIEDIDRIKIEADSTDVFIKHSQDDSKRLVIYGDEELTDYSLENGTLKVSTKSKPCIGICFNNTKSRIEIYLPTEYAGKMSINDKYGDIKIEKFALSKIEISEDAGDVNVLKADNLSIENKYGDVVVGEARILKIFNDCGDIEVTKAEEATIDNNYGDIEISEITGYMNIIADCGDIEIKAVSLTKNSTIKNNLGDIDIGRTNEIYIDAKTDLGDVDVNNNYRDAEFELKIENSCGDITVKN